MIIDTHSHLYVEEFSDDLPAVIERAKAAGIEKILMPNIDDTTIDAMLAACGLYPSYLYPMMGFHPTSVTGHSCKAALDRMEKLLEYENNPYVAIGEVGLDLYWDKTYQKEQIEIFERQIEWSARFSLPLMIHARSAHHELISVMNHYKGEPISGVFHSFTGSEDEAWQLLGFENFDLGINGVVTFKKNGMPAYLPHIPLERIVVETDSPYLAPVPHRGTRNESAYIVNTIECLATIYQKSLSEVAETTKKNALEIFKKVC